MNAIDFIRLHFLQLYLNAKEGKAQGQVATVIGGLVVGLVLLFVGLFMIDTVDNATALASGSSFTTTRSDLINTTGTVFTVLGLVIIIVALATAIGSLRKVSE